MKTKAVLLVALANPKFNLRVNDEFKAIEEACQQDGASEIAELAIPSLDTKGEDLFNRFRRYQDCITVFHFSGHAHHHRLHLHDLKVNTQPINDFLAQQPQLKLVFLNGCNTAAQAKELVQRVPLVIGTHTSISDDLAVQFAESFYKNLLANHNVARSFREAQSEIEANQSQGSRGIVSVDRPAAHSANDWELFWKSKEALEWKLSDFKDDQVQEREIVVALRRMKEKSQMFDAYPNSFENVENSHLPRQETQKLVQWIEDDLPQKPHGEPVPPIKILAGNAGYGKTVIMKEVLANLQKREIPVLALKADHLSYQDVDDLNQKLQLGNYFTDVFRILAKSHERVVVLIDQIDALSRSLSGNHSALTAFQDFINELKSVGEGRVRIIVSCRIYDLEYDLLLQSLKVHDAVKVAALRKEQITQVLQKLDEGIAPQQLPESLWQLLKVPLHLDVFCRVYHPDLQLNSLAAVQDLYDELWEQKINQASEKSKLAPQELSNLIEELAKQMYERQEISLNVRTFKRRNPDALAYLSTERLLIEEQKQLQFFHQSFFDYAFARWFVDAGLSIANELEDKHQGLFLRSKVQQVLAFLRGDDAKEYMEELRTILADEEHVFRFHIQSLLINQLGFEEQPTRQEKQLVQDLILSDLSFFLVFLESARGEQWTRFLLQEHFAVFEALVASRGEVGLSEAEQAYSNQVVNQYGWFCRRQVDKDETQGVVLNFLKSMPEFDWRKDFVTDMFLQFSSFSDPVAFGLLEQYIDETEGWTFYETLKNTLPDHSEWVMDQVWKKFEANLSKIDKTQVNYGGVYFLKGSEATYFMKAFFKEVPDVAFQFAKKALMAIVDCEKATEQGFYLTPSFWTQVPNDYEEDYRHTLDLLDHKTRKHLVKLVATDAAKAQQEIHPFLKTKSLYLISLAAEVMFAKPKYFIREIYELFTQEGFLTSLGGWDYFYYQVQSLLQVAYPHFSHQEKERLNELILMAIPKQELIGYFPDFFCTGKRRNQTFGVRMYDLLSSIPTKERQVFPELVKKHQELQRKFPRYITPREKPKRTNVTRNPQRSLPSEAYEKMNDTQWLDSIKSIQGHEYYFDGKPTETGHIASFSECVTADPKKFLPLLEQFAHDPQINDSFVFAGLEALKEANYNPLVVKELYKLYSTNRIVNREYIRFFGYFIEQKNVDQELVIFLAKIAWNTPDEDYRQQSELKIDKDFSLRNQGFWSLRGYAFELLIACHQFTKYVPFIFGVLEHIIPIASPSTKASILSQLAHLKRYDQDKTFELFLQCIEGFDEELLKVCWEPLQYLYHIDFTRLHALFQYIIEYNLAPTNLGVILMHAWLSDYPKAEELFFELLVKNEKVQVEVIPDIFVCLGDKQDRKKCYKAFNQLLSSENVEVIKAYQYGFYRLLPTTFSDIYELLFNYVQSPVGGYRSTIFYEYLGKCITQNPEKCIELMSFFENHQVLKGKGDFYNQGYTLEILIRSYNALKDYQQKDKSTEQAMDIFDKMLQRPDYRLYAQRAIQKADEAGDQKP